MARLTYQLRRLRWNLLEALLWWVYSAAYNIEGDIHTVFGAESFVGRQSSKAAKFFWRCWLNNDKHRPAEY